MAGTDSAWRARFFRSFLFLTLLFALARSSLPASAEATDVLAFIEERQRAIAEQMERSTLYVLVDEGDSYSMGTAFVVADGYAVTNAHVVESRSPILVMNPYLVPVKASVVRRVYGGGAGEGDDFALLRYASPVSLPPVTFSPRVGRMDRVSAWGFPVLVTQFDQSFEAILEGQIEKAPPVVYTEGTVNAIVEKKGDRTIIHSAAIAGGNSGGPLVNVRGEVVGINTWGYTEEDEGSFVNASLPSERIIAFLLDCGVKPQVASQIPGTAQLPPALSPAETPALSPGDLTPPTKPSSPPAVGERLPEPSGDDESEEILRLARRGDSDAQTALGAMYYDGDGFPQDTKEALRWLEKGKAGGNSYAGALMGIIFLFEEDYADPPRGLALLREAASAPDADSEIQGLLARVFYEGDVFGVERDEDACFEWASKAARGGDPDGMAMLAILYYFGEGVDEDDERALDLAQRAVREDSALGKAILAWMYYDGVAVDEDLNKARLLASDAAEEEVSSAQGLLAMMYLHGYGVAQNAVTAEGWARRAADQGNEFGWFVLGSLYRTGAGVERDPVRAWAYLDMAAQRNVVDASELRDDVGDGLSAKDKKRARDLQVQWRREWGLVP